jgi:hypothetical protein
MSTARHSIDGGCSGSRSRCPVQSTGVSLISVAVLVLMLPGSGVCNRRLKMTGVDELECPCIGLSCYMGRPMWRKDRNVL